ncbi:hypothetical protein [Escherichia coli]|uniref:hypothetical protein n=1 Tax=Escherichia coli TaxID=562 RepID=UPI003A901426
MNTISLTEHWLHDLRVDDEGYPEIARCTEREFATILADISVGGMYCPECGTVH